MSGDCQELKITTPIEKIAAYYSTFTSGGTLASISYIKDGRQKTYGKPTGSFREWDFNDNEVLIGLYGSTDGRKIMKLGFLTLNKYATDSCDDAPPEPVVEEVEEEEVEVQKLGLIEAALETVNGDVTLRFLGLTIMSLLIIFLILCICTQCVKCCCPNKTQVIPI